MTGLDVLAALDGALIVAALIALALAVRASHRRRSQWFTARPSQPDRTADELAERRARRARLNVQPIQRDPDAWADDWTWRG